MWRRLVLWLVLFVPSTGLAAGLVSVSYELVMQPSGFFGVGLGAGISWGIGFVYGACWALVLTLPYAFTLWLWVKLSRFFGDTDTTRLRIALGMLVWSLPQAFLVGIAMGVEPFLLTWVSVAVGLALPRLLARSLAPGAFSGKEQR